MINNRINNRSRSETRFVGILATPLGEGGAPLHHRRSPGVSIWIKIKPWPAIVLRKCVLSGTANRG